MVLSDRTVLAVATFMSIALHLLIVPKLYSSAKTLHTMSPSKSTHLETDSKVLDPIVLGIDASAASTLTWIGYNEYKLHMAQYSRYEQASMEAIDTTVQPMSIAEAFEKLAPPVSKTLAQLSEVFNGIEVSVPSKALPAKTKSIDTPTQSIEQEESEQEAVPSDRDSTPTSVIKVSPEVWKSGKPLAAQGIVLRPRKPSFTANQLVTNAPSDLIAALHINKVGRPIRVERVLSTGSTSIDRALVASLYRWRASGDRIDVLQDDEVVTINIHITFSRN